MTLSTIWPIVIKCNTNLKHVVSKACKPPNYKENIRKISVGYYFLSSYSLLLDVLDCAVQIATRLPPPCGGETQMENQYATPVAFT